MKAHMNIRQEAFVKEYAKNGNATRAAVRAGYSPRSARVTGHRLLTNASLRQRLYQEGELSIETLLEIASKGKNEIARVRAAEVLLERAYGKVATPSKEQTHVKITFNRIDARGNVVGATVNE